MSPDTHILLSGALSFGVPLLLAVRELVALARWKDEPGRRGDDARGPAPATPPDDDDDASLPPLPAGFIQPSWTDPVPARPPATRVLEDA